MEQPREHYERLEIKMNFDNNDDNSNDNGNENITTSYNVNNDDN